MGLFEQRVSDEQVTAARARMDAGASLRTAAAEIPCAPSTLSVRLKKAKAVEEQARALAGIGEVQAAPNPVVEVLRAALQATKQNGQPDWAIRVGAARTLATLYPEQVEPEPEPEPETATIVYDLPAGRSPILHRAPPPPFAPKGSEPPPDPRVEPGTYLLEQAGEMVLLVRHAPDGDAPTRFLHDRHVAAEIVRAFGGDPSFLDTLADPDRQPAKS